MIGFHPGYILKSFLLYINLGGNTASLESTMQVELGKWNKVEIKREGRYGDMTLNDISAGDMTR